MIILIVLTVLLATGIFTSCYAEPDWDIAGGTITIIAGVVLFVTLLTLPLNQFNVKSDMAKFEMTKQTIAIARENGNELEKVAVQNKIIEINQWLAGQKYWNETALDIWIPDEVMKLEPLR